MRGATGKPLHILHHGQEFSAQVAPIILLLFADPQQAHSRVCEQQVILVDARAKHRKVRVAEKERK